MGEAQTGPRLELTLIRAQLVPPADESAKDYAVPEKDYATHSSPERSLGQIEKIQAE